MELNVSSAADNDTSFLWLNDSSIDFHNNNETETNSSTTTSSTNYYGGFNVAQAIINFLNLYYQGTIIVVGLLGNGRNVYLFLRNKKELRSPSYYLAALALVDVIFLVTLLILWLSHFGIYLFTHSVFYDLLFYLSSTSSCISGTVPNNLFLTSLMALSNYFYFIAAWLIAAFTFERFIVVRYPLKRSKLCTVRRAKIIIGCLVVAAFIIQIVGLLPTGVVAKSSPAKGNSSSASRPVARRVLIYFEVMRVLNMLETGMTQIVPPIIIVVLNALIIRSLIQFNKTFKTGEMNRHRSTSSSSTKLRRRNELLINELASVAIIPAKSQGDAIHINLDVIETGVDERHQSPQNTDHPVVKLSEDVTSLMAGDADYQSQPQQRSSGCYSSEIKVKNRRQSNRTEYTITKKLVAISTVHILLNLPR